MASVHIPILLEPILHSLIEPFRVLPETSPPHWVVDCTFGGGGHSGAILAAFENDPRLKKHRVLGLDRDLAAVEEGRKRFEKEISEGRLEITQSRFSHLSSIIEERPVLGVLADLGFSSDQVNTAERGLSFQAEGPLDMRLDSSTGRSCQEILNDVSEKELESWLREYGEERFSKRIAGAIINCRRQGRLPSTTRELVEIIVQAVPPGARHGRIHVATRTFQALRIVVNEELSELDSLLNQGILCLQPGGRAAIMSFHSLEDRRVKNRFYRNSGPQVESSPSFIPLTRKPIQADEEEIRMNPRSRSAKLRIVERTK